MTGLTIISKAIKKAVSPKPLFISSAIALSLQLTACADNKTDIEYFQSATEYVQQQDWKAASIEIKNALQLNPANTKARILLAELYLRNQNGIAAEKELEKAVKYGTNENEVLALLVKAYYYQFKFTDILDKSLNIENIEDDTESEIFMYRGIASLNLKKKTDADTDFKMSTHKSATSKYGKLSDVFISALAGDAPAALSKVNSIIESHPDFADAYLLRAEIYLQQETSDLKKAIADYKRLLELEPSRLIHYFEYAKLLVNDEQLEEAEKNVDTILRTTPNHLPGNLLKAGIRLRLNDFETAVKYADTVLAGMETNSQAKLIAGTANFHLKKYELSRKQLKSVINQIPADHVAHRMLAYAEFKLGYVDEANETISAIGDHAPKDSQLFNQFGAELAMKGDIGGAQQWYEKAFSLNPDDANAKTRLGILQLMQDDDRGVAHLKQAIQDEEKSPLARAALVSYYLKQGNVDEALRLSKEYTVKRNQDPESLSFYANTLLRVNKLEDAENQLKKALQKDSTNIPALMTLVRVDLIKQDHHSAYDHLNSVIQVNSSHEQALTQLFGVARKINKQDDAIKRIISAGDANPDNKEIRIVEALAYLSLNQQDTAKTVLDLIEPKDQSSYLKAQTLLGHIELNAKQYDKALEHYNNKLLITPNDSTTFKQIAQTYIKMGQPKDALQQIQSALQKIPNDRELQLIEIQLLFDNNQPQQANKKAQSMLSREQSPSAVRAILGKAAAQSKDYKQAIQHYSELHKLEPSTRSLLMLVSAHTANDENKKADKLLSEWLKQHPDDAAVRMFKANRDVGKDHSAAISNYREVLKKSPNNFVAYNNLAWALGQTGKLEQALEYAAKAYELRPDVPQVSDTYGFLLFQAGDTEKAEKLLKESHEKMPNDPSIIYHYALALNKNGKASIAKPLLARALESDFEEKSDAEKLHKQLKK